jgi:hypothetical protein
VAFSTAALVILALISLAVGHNKVKMVSTACLVIAEQAVLWVIIIPEQQEALVVLVPQVAVVVQEDMAPTLDRWVVPEAQVVMDLLAVAVLPGVAETIQLMVPQVAVAVATLALELLAQQVQVVLEMVHLVLVER